MTFPPGILARGPWQRGQVAVSWHEDAFEPDADQNAAADRAIAELEDRGSPAHDGLAARLCGFHADEALLRLDLQPTRWSLRLGEDAANSLSVLCVARDAAGRWLAGRRAPWVATWAGRWALGAGGSVEVGENPVEALTRELEEEWSVRPERLTVEALVALPSGLAMLVGQAWLADGVEVERDAEHDDHAWWPSEPAGWPEEADPALRRMATLLGTDHLHPPQVPLVRPLGGLPDAARRLAVRRPGRAARRAGMGARHRLDRDVAAVHRRRPDAGDPAVAGGHGRGRRRHWTVCRFHRLRGV